MSDAAADLVVAAVQLASQPGDVEANLGRGLELAAQAARQGAKLIVLPECALSGYEVGRDELGEAARAIPGPETDRISLFARDRGVTIVVGILERSDGAFFNAAVTCLPDGRVGLYRKTHLPRLGLDRYCERGDLPYEVLRAPCGNVGTLICYDLRFPEPARVLSLAGMDVLAVPTAWPRTALDYPDFLDRARASENRVILVVADHAAAEKGSFLGRSQIVAADGRVVAEAGESEEVLVACLSAQDRQRAAAVAGGADGSGGLLADRRPDLYVGLTGGNSR